MDILDFSWNDKQSKRHNIALLPRRIRGLIIGKSGCGKTTLLLNLLLRTGWLDYNNLQVFGKSLFQPEYKIIKKAFEEGLTKEAILQLFMIQDQITKLQLSTELVIEETAKKSPKNQILHVNSLKIQTMYQILGI
jgi:ABC-type glutathione transport system ATPase component